MKFSKLIVLLVIMANALFAGAVLLIFARDNAEPSTLIGAWFAFTTGELWALSKIEREKGMKERRKKDGGHY